MKNLTIYPQPIGELLANNQFVVPTYQRSFAWTALHVENLLKDIRGAMARMAAGKGEKYFLGTLVFIERQGKPLEVVDGQQRLATISIIFAAIRDFHLRLGKKKAARSYNQYLLRDDVPTGRKLARIRLNDVDDRCFAKAVLREPTQRESLKWSAPSHLRIVEAYDAAKKFVDAIASTHNAKNTVKALDEIVEYLRTYTQVIRVMVGDDADAFTIFETLNDRNAHLTVADLLKNFLFGTSRDSIEVVKGNWKEMAGALGSLKGKRDKTVDYIRQLWGSMHGLTREKDLFRDIKEKITTDEEAVELAGQIAEQAGDYVAVLNPDNELWDGRGAEVANALRTFNVLRIERIRPLLLAILKRFDKVQVDKALSYLRSAAVRIILTTGINGTIEDKLFETAVKVHDKTVRKASQLSTTMSSFVPNDSVFRARVATMTMTKDALARFYLQEIQDAASTDATQTDRNEKRVDLEHIIPKSPKERKDNWPELTEEESEALFRRFGNLTLCLSKDNSKLHGSAYAVKVKVYAKYNTLPLTSSIARDYPTEFGRKQVEARQEKLANLAIETWPIPEIS